MRGDIFFSRIASKPPFTRLDPRAAVFFKDYFSNEKVIEFRDSHVVNTNFPPFPSAAFDQLVEQYQYLGEAIGKRLYSVTLAITNRCNYECWHCYNAGRSQVDIPLARLKALAKELQDRGAVIVTLTGGEPLLREDVEEIVGAFDQRSCLILGTTGAGPSPARP
ncbi:MAG: radical SAM protein, partial [Candidatus Omnitrophica bacterium]|nr:radical SAM protein [Candidatus Omnitrophota bacterium]